VKLWITFNEPLICTWYGYGSGEDAPGHREPATEPFLAAHTILRAHAMAYGVYDKEFRPAQGGEARRWRVGGWG
jgi:beta-glucosidase/6-phospho-beta-glucosidase/beta-galactosidase